VSDALMLFFVRAWCADALFLVLAGGALMLFSSSPVSSSPAVVR
jgi:hypothetical protein